MQKSETVDDKPAPAPKNNLSAKIGVALGFSVVGGKLAIPGLVMDANRLFPSGTPLGEKFQRIFSPEILTLLNNDMAKHIQRGRSTLTALLLTTKWSNLLWLGGTLGLGTIGWMRADRIQNSKDIVKHPIESTKIIFGLKNAPLETEAHTTRHRDGIIQRNPHSAGTMR